jgi:hypothetical protein
MKGRLKKLKLIPKFRSRKEERDFWEIHDTTEYFDEEDLVKLAPHIKDVRLIHVYMAPDGSRYIMIPEEMKKTRARIANSRKTSFLAAN